MMCWSYTILRVIGSEARGVLEVMLENGRIGRVLTMGEVRSVMRESANNIVSGVVGR